MITSEPKEFWNEVGLKENWRNFVYPKRTDKESEEEGSSQAVNLIGGFNSPGVFVDYGCGDGRVIRNMAQFAERAIGLDISESIINIAKKKGGAEFHVIDEFDEKEIADFVFCLSVMQHNERKNQLEILRGIRDIMKPGAMAHIYFASGKVYRETSFVHVFDEDEVRNLASLFFNDFEIKKGNLVRYYGMNIELGETNEIVLIAKK
jgi:2-polyprenyl-3-methyl-5-hydroxy-6-metoxy-1,4-benzoquinol methylase